jgi:hypothetical protein
MIDRTKPQPFQLSNGSDNRSPDRYVEVLRQFCFDTDPRYQPGDGATFCNIAQWDASRALACEVPHWWIRADGQYGEEEEPINKGILWLAHDGGAYGWSPVTADDAKLAASLGKPTLVTWSNPLGHGHVAWVMPDWSLAQAGAVCGYGIAFPRVFTAAMMSQLQFWAHP